MRTYFNRVCIESIGISMVKYYVITITKQEVSKRVSRFREAIIGCKK